MTALVFHDCLEKMYNRNANGDSQIPFYTKNLTQLVTSSAKTA